MSVKRDLSRSELTEILRRGDPLGEGGPTLEELANVRRRVLNTALQPQRSLMAARRRPIVIAAAVATITAAAVGGRWLLSPEHTSRSGQDQPRNPPAANALPIARAPNPPASPLTAGEDASRHAVNARPSPMRLRGSSRTGTAAIADINAGPQQPRGPSERTPRQLQFTTAGGTRIVWVLNANFALPEKPVQQEEPRCSAE